MEYKAPLETYSGKVGEVVIGKGEKAVKIGANVIMPNITPGIYRDSYNLYENKPRTFDADDDCKECLEARLKMVDAEPGYGEWGDAEHYYKRRQKTTEP